MEQIGVGSISIGKLERQYINLVLSSGRLSYGPFIQEFEKEFSKLHEVKYSSFCNSGTSALQVALHALKIKYNYEFHAEILVPALTFVASVNVILQNGLRPVFVDVDPTYFEIDPVQIEKKITPLTRAIMVVHVGGLPCDMGPIMKIAKKNNLQVIEDSCETMFASYEGKSVGSFGDVSCFSTYVAHILTTGVGGFACTSDPELAVLIKSLMNHGRDNIYISIDDDKVSGKAKLAEVVSKRFKFDYVGYSYRATEFEGALGLAQIQKFEANIAKRRSNAQRLTKGLANLSEHLQTPQNRPNSSHSYMFYPLVCQNYVNRDDLVNYLEQHGIETRFLLPLTNQPVYQKMWPHLESMYPVTRKLNNQAFYIGCYPGLTNKDIDYMISVFQEYFNEN